MYADLNIQWPAGAPALAEQRAAEMLALLVELQYDVVALNVVAASPKEAKQVLATSLAPALPRLRALFPLRILKRVTLVLDDGTTSPNLALLAGEPGLFDIVAVAPRTEKQLQSCATALDIDLICIETGSRLPFPLRHKLCGAAVARGVCFEVCYAARALRHLVANAAILFRAARHRGVVVSSGAASAADLRAPLDVANLVALWGLNPAAAKNSVSVWPVEQATQGVLRSSAKQAVISQPSDAKRVKTA